MLNLHHSLPQSQYDEFQPVVAKLMSQGHHFLSHQNFPQAIDFFTQALNYDPRHAPAYHARAKAYQAVGESTKAHQDYEYAYSADPENHQVLNDLFELSLETCDFDTQSSAYNHLTSTTHALIQKRQIPSQSLYFTLAHSGDQELVDLLIQTQSAALKAQVAFRYQPIPQKPRLQKNKPLCLGFYTHHTQGDHLTYALISLINHLDPQEFTPIIFTYNSTPQSLLHQLLDKSITIDTLSDLPDNNLAASIRNNGVDILIDTTAFTPASRTAPFYLHPAARILHWAGFPGALKTNAIDSVLKPQPSPYFYPPSPLPPTLPTGISPDSFQNKQVLACFSPAHLITHAQISLWFDILNTHPHTVLWLSDYQNAAKVHLSLLAKEKNIDSTRLVFLPRVPRHYHLGLLPQVSLYLDTHPVNSPFEALDALSLGIPVLTLKSTTPASSHTPTILRHLKLETLITTPKDYLSKTTHLLTTPKAYQDLKTQIQKNTSTSPLFDPQKFATNFTTSLLNQIHLS
jgi:predicted O-linked N-acetylglucosamine transferase (SPINDLY family)